MIRILLVTQANHTGLTYHRQLIPHLNLENNHRLEYQVVPCHDINEVPDENLKDFQIVSFLRLVDERFRTAEIVKRCKDAGCKVVIDIDDYWILHKDHELKPKYTEFKIAEQTLEGLKLADWVTTTTEHFADKIREHNPNVTVLPNSIDKDQHQFKVNPTESERVRIGWIGGIFHIPDVRLMYNGFQELYKDISPKKYQLCLGGFNVNNQYQFLEMLFTNGYKNINPVYRAYLEKYLEEGNDRVVDESYKRLWAKDVFHYGGMYNELDVCLVPLCENNFNSYKSQIKIIEAGWFKKPVIVSNVMPYTLDCTNRNSILVSPNKRNEGWGSAIKSLILNPSKREDLSEALHEHVKAKYDMDVVNVVRHQLYQSLCE